MTQEELEALNILLKSRILRQVKVGEDWNFQGIHTFNKSDVDAYILVYTEMDITEIEKGIE